MLQVKNVTLRFGSRTLFEDVNLEFKGDSCYGIIGALRSENAGMSSER